MADVTFTDQNFESDVLKADKPVLVDFWAEWCTPCLVQGPIVDEIAQEFQGQAVVGKLNVDENMNTAQTYGVMSIPTVMIFKGGQLAKQFVGVQSKETLVNELKKLIN
jgi:thioredoxin 1